MNSVCLRLVNIAVVNLTKDILKYQSISSPFINRREWLFLVGNSFGDRIIAGVSRRRGNLISTCCGALRQPQYRLEIVFPGSRETRQPRYKNKYITFCIAAVMFCGYRERETGYTTAAIYNSRNKKFLFLYCGSLVNHGSCTSKQRAAK